MVSLTLKKIGLGPTFKGQHPAIRKMFVKEPKEWKVSLPNRRRWELMDPVFCICPE
jgi:hypothetical protein